MAIDATAVYARNSTPGGNDCGLVKRSAARSQLHQDRCCMPDPQRRTIDTARSADEWNQEPRNGRASVPFVDADVSLHHTGVKLEVG